VADGPGDGIQIEMFEKSLARLTAKILVKEILHQVMRGYGQPVRFSASQSIQEPFFVRHRPLDSNRHPRRHSRRTGRVQF
jgi:hypothetical protein